MEKVTSVSKLKASLSAYLELVKAGEEIIVTDRGKPVARVVPMTEGYGSESDLGLLVREGVLRPGNGQSLIKVLPDMPLATSESSIVEALLEERESGW